MRINKYLAEQGFSTRRGADELIEKKRVFINGHLAVLGDQVYEGDEVEVRGAGQPKTYEYYAYNKPRGVITHSPQGDEQDIKEVSPLTGVYPIGRLDKGSHGLLILTNDGRVTDRLLNPKHEHEKEYVVKTVQNLRPSFKIHMEKGVDLGDMVTKRCKVQVTGDRTFKIILTEGKKHQIRRMCAALHLDVADLERTRVMNIKLGVLKPNQHRPLAGAELSTFLKNLGL